MCLLPPNLSQSLTRNIQPSLQSWSKLSLWCWNAEWESPSALFLRSSPDPIPSEFVPGKEYQQWLRMLSSSQSMIHLYTACLNQFREELSFLIHFFHLCKSSKGHSRTACSFWSSGMNSIEQSTYHTNPLACSNCFSQTSKATEKHKNPGSSLAYPHAQQRASRRLFQCCSVRSNASTKRLAG